MDEINEVQQPSIESARWIMLTGMVLLQTRDKYIYFERNKQVRKNIASRIGII